MMGLNSQVVSIFCQWLFLQEQAVKSPIDDGIIDFHCETYFIDLFYLKLHANLRNSNMEIIWNINIWWVKIQNL